MDYFKCEACNGVYQEGEETHEHISGRKGGYDDWMPDEDFHYCPHCDANITDGGCYEYGMEDAIEELQKRPTCEEVAALRDEVERLETEISHLKHVCPDCGYAGTNLHKLPDFHCTQCGFEQDKAKGGER